MRRPRLIFGDRRILVAAVLDAWLTPDYRYFKLKGADGDTYLVRHDERSNTWELTCSERNALTNHDDNVSAGLAAAAGQSMADTSLKAE